MKEYLEILSKAFLFSAKNFKILLQLANNEINPLT